MSLRADKYRQRAAEAKDRAAQAQNPSIKSASPCAGWFAEFAERGLKVDYRSVWNCPCREAEFQKKRGRQPPRRQDSCETAQPPPHHCTHHTE
jgi:hypothetical protein